MIFFNRFCRLVNKVFYPIRNNARFFVFMYILGLVCALNEIPLHLKGATSYPLAWIELFFDLYVLCLVIVALPKKIRVLVRRIICVMLYFAAIVDVFCYVKFESTLTPTMLLLVGETDGREAGEFLSSYITTDIFNSLFGVVLLIVLFHILSLFYSRSLHRKKGRFYMLQAIINDNVRNLTNILQPFLSIATLILLVYGAIVCSHNKIATYNLMSASNIGDVEHTLTEKKHAELYLPIDRLFFSLYANHLASKQVDKLINSMDKVVVDSCSYRSKNIILIIGESYNKHHSQLYGYDHPTTPRQLALAKTGLLIPFTDVVSPWNLTSFVFKNVFSTHALGEPGEWCDGVLFPQLFRKAGYHVSFITNQFLPKAKEAVYDFSGGFFLNNPQLSKSQFDTRNTSLHTYDDGLLKDYDELRKFNGKDNLIIFHLMGQHVNYKQRYPSDRKFFTPESYDRPALSGREKYILSDYDNATRYNDSIVACIVNKFYNEDAIVIYMPDHGEECFDNDYHFYGRLHSSVIDYRLAREEFEIPFWIWCSHKYATTHPYIFKEIVDAKKRPFMTDNLSHMLLYLAGIHCPQYKSKYNLLSPDYDLNRPRMLKLTTDYNKLEKK